MYLTVAVNTYDGREVLHAKDRWLFDAEDRARTCDSAHVFDADGNIVRSSHWPQPPKPLYGPHQ
jgi:hypothetical protein